jgi:hypothetical protein
MRLPPQNLTNRTTLPRDMQFKEKFSINFRACQPSPANNRRSGQFNS